MNKAVAVSDFIWTGILVIMSGFQVIAYLLIALLLLSNSYKPSEQLIDGDLTLASSIGLIFLSPLCILAYTYFGKVRTQWADNFLSAAIFITLLFTVLGGISWYFYPEMSRLEPMSYLLGLVTAWTTYIKTRLPPQQLISESPKVEPIAATVLPEGSHHIWYV